MGSKPEIQVDDATNISPIQGCGEISLGLLPDQFIWIPMGPKQLDMEVDETIEEYVLTSAIAGVGYLIASTLGVPTWINTTFIISTLIIGIILIGSDHI